MQHTSEDPSRRKAVAYLERLQRSLYSKLGTLPAHMLATPADYEQFYRNWYEQRGGSTQGQPVEEFLAEMQSEYSK